MICIVMEDYYCLHKIDINKDKFCLKFYNTNLNFLNCHLMHFLKKRFRITDRDEQSNKINLLFWTYKLDIIANGTPQITRPNSILIKNLVFKCFLHDETAVSLEKDRITNKIIIISRRIIKFHFTFFLLVLNSKRIAFELFLASMIDISVVDIDVHRIHYTEVHIEEQLLWMEQVQLTLSLFEILHYECTINTVWLYIQPKRRFDFFIMSSCYF